MEFLFDDPSAHAAKEPSLANLPDDVLGVIFDQLVCRECVGSCYYTHGKCATEEHGYCACGFRALANFVAAFKPAWLAEKKHRYAEVYATPRSGHPSWFSLRAGRVDHVVYNALNAELLDEEIPTNTRYLQAFADCGSEVVLHAHKPYSTGNIVQAHLFMFGWNWETDVAALVDMLVSMPRCRVAIESCDLDSAGGYEKGQVLRNEYYARPLVPFADRLDLSKLSFLVRNDRIGYWAQEAFPLLRNITWANPVWLTYGAWTFGDDIDSEETEDEEDR